MVPESGPPLPLAGRLVAAGFAAACACVFAMGVRLWWPLLVDDAFITFRYADNIAGGHGIVWNIGEERTEGYSSPLHLLLLVPAALAGIPLLGFMKVFGVLAVGAAVPLLFARLVSTLDWRGENGARTAALLVPGLWLLMHPNVVHAVSAMETSLALLVYAAFALSVHAFSRIEPDAPRRRLLGVAVWLLAVMAMLVRSEGGAVAVAGLASLAVYPRTRRAALGMLGAFFAVLAAYLAWKWFYFGYLLPNPFYHKVAPEGSGRFPGLPEVRGFLNHHLYMVLLPLLAWVVNPPSRQAPLGALELMCCGAAGFYTVFLLRVVHIMGYDFRFCWHAMPFFAMLAILSIHRLATRPSGAGSEPSRSPLARIGSLAATALAAAGLLVAACLRLPLQTTLSAFRNPLDPPAVFDAGGPAYFCHWRVGKVLQALQLDYSTTTVSALEAGIIPYLCRTRTIDTVVLNDNVITRGTPEEKQRRLAENPLDVFYTVSTTGALDDLAVPPDRIEADPEGIRNWSREKFMENARTCYYGGSYHWGCDPVRQYFVLWVRRSHPRAEEIAAALLEGADRVDADLVRWGPYDEAIGAATKIPGFADVVAARGEK